MSWHQGKFNESVYLTNSSRIIQKLQEEMKVSKNTWAHSKMAYFLYLIVKTYPFETCLIKQANYLELWIQQALSDANPEAR